VSDRVRSLLSSATLWLVVALLSASAVFPFHPPFREKKTEYVFEVIVSSSSRGFAKLHYDLGRGFNEQDSGAVLVRGGVGPRSFQFSLPAGRYYSLRLDPLDHPSEITISSAVIRDNMGHEVMRFPPSKFLATKGVRLKAISGDTLSIDTVPGAGDPALLINLDKPFDLLRSPSREWITFLEWFSGVYLALAAAILSASLLTKLGTTGLGRLVCRPKTTLALTALLALLLNCFPVIFCGRSFVSPNCGVLLLYEDIPTLPGYTSPIVKNGHGSDVGAAMWWHVPISNVQHEAIFHDHELPLWNRYNLCGQSLLGQGQSMIGDPLHLVTAVLGNGSALAWDIKYLAAKWLFAFGIGLTVLAITNRLVVAALLSTSSLYIGFFSFYLNHPTFFSLCYSPWILFAWIRLSGTLNAYRSTAWATVLIVADWFEINSGTVKEAYVLTIWLNLAGLLVLLFNRDNLRLKVGKVLVAAWANILFVLISAPIWSSFVDTLKGSFTSYALPQARQIPATQLIGFFEDLFYRQNTKEELHVAPSANFLVLLGALWALPLLKRLAGNRMLLALGTAAVVPCMLVFGIIPKAAIIALPFLGNIFHIDSTFSCVLIILAIPIAGLGLTFFLESLHTDDWNFNFAIVLSALGALLLLYFSFDRHLGSSAFFTGYVPVLIVAFVMIQLAARHLERGCSNRSSGLMLLFLGLFAIHWRQGQYLDSAFDDYVFEPQVRADFKAKSPAIQFVEQHESVASRTIGLGANLFLGFNCTYLLEDIYGIDALRSMEYEELAEALGLERVIAFSKYQADEGSNNFRAAFDSLNVTYLLGASEPTPGEYAGWEMVRDLDLKVFKSQSVWPRAFFVDRIMQYRELPEMVAFVRKAKGHPLAAIQEKDFPDLLQLGLLSNDPAGRRVISAYDYSLTNNSTSFDIEAPSPGVVVLSETWLRDDFEVTVNDKSVPYFRVNHAFKGIFIDSPGRYRVSFKYWPHRLTFSLWISALGVSLAFGSLLFARRLYRLELTGDFHKCKVVT